MKNFINIKNGVYVRPESILHVVVHAVGSDKVSPTDYQWDYLSLNADYDKNFLHIDIKVSFYMSTMYIDGSEGGPEYYELLGENAMQVMEELMIPFDSDIFLAPYKEKLLGAPANE